MKGLPTKSLRIIPAGLCLLFTFLANHVWASIDFWDPQGSNPQSPYLGSLSGTWENNSWSTSVAGQTTPGAWVEGSQACFAVKTGASTPAFTVTMNANHTVEGIYNGYLTYDSCNVTISGTGTMNLPLPAGLYAFALWNTSGNGGSGKLTINTVIAGLGPILLEDGGTGLGQLYLNGANTYTGGTYLGYTEALFAGIVNFNNNASFGSGTIQMIAGSGSALVAEGTSAITIPNNFVNSQANASLNMVGNAAGVTFSGTWGLGANSIKIGSSGASANRVIISGVISGSGGLTKFGSGVLVLSGANTYSGGTTVSSGTLLADNTSGSGTGSGAVTVSSGGTLNVTGAITGTSVGVSSGGTLGGAGTINAPITVSSGGTLTLVDDAIDTLAVNGDMTLSGTTSLEVEETSGDADLIASSGTVTLGGNLTVVQLDPANPFVLGDTFHLIGGSFAGTFNTCTLPALSPGLAWDTSQLGPGGNGSIVVATAPSAAPQSTGITPLSGGNFSLTATGTAGTPWSLHASDDMAAPQPWPVLQTGSITASPFTVNDPTASSHQQRFYRFSTP